MLGKGETETRRLKVRLLHWLRMLSDEDGDDIGATGRLSGASTVTLDLGQHAPALHAGDSATGGAAPPHALEVGHGDAKT